MMNNVLRALGIVLAVCLGVRICWLLVEPLLAPLGVLLLFVVLGWLLFIGPRYRG